MFNFEPEMNSSSSGNQADTKSKTWLHDLRYGTSGSKNKPSQTSRGPSTTIPKLAEEDEKTSTKTLPKVAKKSRTKSPRNQEFPPKQKARKSNGSGSDLQTGPGDLEKRTEPEKKANDNPSSSSSLKNETSAAGKTMDGGESKEPYKHTHGLVVDPWTGVCRYVAITPTTKVKVCTPKPFVPPSFDEILRRAEHAARNRAQMKLKKK